MSTFQSQRSGSICRPGFTIVELLVVIAVIGVLLTMLLPTMTKARAVAQNAVCCNNLRQLGVASYIYGNNYRSYSPSNPSHQQGDTTKPWYIQLRDVGALPDTWGPARTVQRADGGTYAVDDIGSGYGGNNSTPPPLKSAAWCPSAQVKTVVVGGPSANYYYNAQFTTLNGWPNDGLYRGTSYTINNWLTTDSPSFQGHYGGGAQPWGRYTFENLDNSGESSKVMLLYCAPCSFGENYPVPYEPFATSDLNLRHDDHWNVAHWDGHVGAYHQSGWEYFNYPSSGLYPWFPRRQAPVWPGDTGPPMGSFTTAYNMITLN